MQRFDCLASNSPLFGPHLLEASAGTGKTFAIEHIYARLILEALQVEEILVVTFTRAATRELKMRIRSNLENILLLLQTNEAPFEYLRPHLNSSVAIQRLSDAIACFDRCQIFTIHGFCYRMLKEFAFEASVGSLANPDEAKGQEKLKNAALDFVENGIDENLLSLEQLSLLLKEFESVDEIVKRLIQLEDFAPSLSFSEISAKCKAALHMISENIEEEKLVEDFRALEKNYKVSVKGDFESQIRGLARGDIRPLLKEKGSLFKFLSLENRKVKAVEPSLYYPHFFTQAAVILPFLNQKIFPVLQKAFQPIAEKILTEEEELNHDEILAQMGRSIQNAQFATAIQKKYKAALIDEFQDTDALQWDIFQKLFFSVQSLFLVGDPKQSIYRFRKADIYTYLKARDSFGEENIYCLDTNFRSSKSLIGALNALFTREWLQLPKLGRTLPYQPVRAGSKLETSFQDGKGALHFFSAGEENLLPFVAREIETLKLENVAILVKDRYQADEALAFLKTRGINAIARSHIPIGKTVGFQAVRELFDAVFFPHDANLAKIVAAGPFAKFDSFAELKSLLSLGLIPFARRVLEEIDCPEILQVFEHLFAWERKEGDIRRFFTTFRSLTSEEGGRQRIEVDEKAVQIMTMHVSKGLEFDVVFALGLSSRTPESEEADESNAEKLHQLYVAMTRAKKRLYVPIVEAKREGKTAILSPLELFAKHFEGSFLDALHTLGKTESITIEEISLPILLPPAKEVVQKNEGSTLKLKPFKPQIVASFTTLAAHKERELSFTSNDPNLFTLQTMPRGSETGVILHEVFEQVFSSVKPEWNDAIELGALTPWKEAISQMVKDVLQMPLADGFCLADIEQFQTEMEFLFPFSASSIEYIKGFIDLVFTFCGKIYFLDWKSNWLENYETSSLEKAMQANDYELQASLYAESLKRYAPEMEFGGAFYIFVRGPALFQVRNFDRINDVR